MNYNTKNHSKARFILFLLIACIIAAGIGWLIGMAVDAEGYEPDAVFPMANTNVSWEQTFHSGGWTEADPG